MKRGPRPHRAIRAEIKRDVYARDQGKCFWCGTALTLEQSTLDHIEQRCRGGKFSRGNLILACLPCNSQRGDKDAFIYLHEVSSKSRGEHA